MKEQIVVVTMVMIKDCSKATIMAGMRQKNIIKNYSKESVKKRRRNGKKGMNHCDDLEEEDSEELRDSAIEEQDHDWSSYGQKKDSKQRESREWFKN